MSNLGRIALHDTLDSALFLQASPGLGSSVDIIERKGLGHPDTLTDQLAESLSRAYSNWTLEHAGAVLHHNFDKTTMHGGAVRVVYGGGSVAAPIRVMVNGRVTQRCGTVLVPVEDLIRETVRAFFAERLPEFSDHLDIQLNLTSNPSPGSVQSTDERTERLNWFDIDSVDQLRERRLLVANDTSMGTGFYPLSAIESFARTLVDELSGDSEFRRANPWCGTDVKMMAFGSGGSVEAVLAVPQISAHVPSRRAYVANRDAVRAYCLRRATELLGAEAACRSSFRINARDIDERDELYLTLSGSSLESGDEGVVGRGNRVNGLITPLRPMNLEGVNGKNPVYHVGKLYNLAAEKIARALHELFGGQHYVSMISATGQELAYPWRVHVQSSEECDPALALKVVQSVTEAFPQLTKEILAGAHSLA